MIICLFQHPDNGSDCCAMLDDEGVLTVVDEESGSELFRREGTDKAEATRVLLDAGLSPSTIKWES